MANIKSQIKRNRTNEARRQRNVSVKSRVKTYQKKMEDAFTANDAAKVNELLPAVLSELDRAASKGILHKNSAARRKSHYQRRAATLAATK